MNQLLLIFAAMFAVQGQPSAFDEPCPEEGYYTYANVKVPSSYEPYATVEYKPGPEASILCYIGCAGTSFCTFFELQPKIAKCLLYKEELDPLDLIRSGDHFIGLPCKRLN